MKIALVLGGGGARGLAHIGVLRILEKAGIKIDQIVGCSFGAMVGAMYAQTPQADVVEKKLREFINTREFANLGLNLLRKKSVMSDDYLQQFSRSVKDWVMLNVVTRRSALLKGERLLNAIRFLVREGDLRDTRIPFACNATDLISGKPHLFQSGDIHTAIAASSTIPGYFSPVEFEGKRLVDGAVTYSLPVTFARQLGADFVIGVDVRPGLQPEPAHRNILEVVLRASAITAQMFAEERANPPDLMISPAIKEYFWYEFDRFREIIKAGEEATRLVLDKIPRARFYSRKGIRRLLRPDS